MIEMNVSFLFFFRYKMGQICLVILIVLLVSGTFAATPGFSMTKDHPEDYPQADSNSDEKVRIF